MTRNLLQPTETLVTELSSAYRFLQLRLVTLYERRELRRDGRFRRVPLRLSSQLLRPPLQPE